MGGDNIAQCAEEVADAFKTADTNERPCQCSPTHQLGEKETKRCIGRELHIHILYAVKLLSGPSLGF